MADDWPSDDDLTLDPRHLVWKFSPTISDSVIFVVGYENCDTVDFEIHQSYALVLAIFDIHYWQAMLLPHTLHNGNILMKVRMLQKYLQNLRVATAMAVRSADKAELLDGSWQMEVTRHWSIRTWSNFSHSPFSCTEYIKKCEGKGFVPYSKPLTQEGMQFSICYLVLSIVMECY